MNIRLIVSLLAALVAGAAITTQAADLKSPDQVKNALRILAYVQADMASKLPGKNFNRLPNENKEFQQAAPALRDAIAAEPAAFKAKVDARLTEAQAAANNAAEVSKSNDEAKIIASVTAVDAALKRINALFPEALRPVAGQLGSGPAHGAVDRRGADNPPSDLR